MNIDYIKSLIKLVEESQIEELEEGDTLFGIISINLIRIKKHQKIIAPQLNYQQPGRAEKSIDGPSLSKIVKGESYHDEYHGHSQFSEYVHPGHSIKPDKETG